VPRAVADPNVLVSAAIAPNGVCRRLLDAVLESRLTLVVCPLLLTELRDVLVRPKFRRYLSVEQAHAFVGLVSLVAEHQADPPSEQQLTPDPDDDYLLALATSAGVDFMVSGDPHLTEIVGHEPPVVGPAAALAKVRN
jgi:putative PIN family toxin of toxin-antitoxin system